MNKGVREVEFLEQLEAAVAKVDEQVGPSVVRIGKGFGRGNGVVTAAGQVLTNAHNLRGPETTVTFADGRVAVGTAAGVDLDGDLAVLNVDTGEAPAIRWEPGSAAAGGSAVFAVAATVGGGRRVTFGTVSAVGRAFRGPRGWRIGGSLEHTAPLGRGSSGSPVVDGKGSFLGLNTNRLGVALAPPRAARELRRAVGLPDRDGLLIRGVEDDSPGDRAGLRKGDLIVEAAGRALATPDDLFDALENVSADGSLVLKVVRGSDELEVRVAFGAGRVEGSA